MRSVEQSLTNHRIEKMDADALQARQSVEHRYYLHGTKDNMTVNVAEKMTLQGLEFLHVFDAEADRVTLIINEGTQYEEVHKGVEILFYLDSITRGKHSSDVEIAKVSEDEWVEVTDES
jgi:sulfur relay (sulfurtransferase) complex TusBCD TusD component (DsrE family)